MKVGGKAPIGEVEVGGILPFTICQFAIVVLPYASLPYEPFCDTMITTRLG